jgi:histidyl-tRNA synthetase
LPKSKAQKNVAEVLELCKKMGVPDDHIMLDLSLARGLDYYTGIIYEVIIPDSGLGSVCGGGRYDNLTGLFSHHVFPGTGVAFGFDRLMVWMEENHKLASLTLNSRVLIAHFPDTVETSLKTLNTLQKAGINSELYLDEDKLQKQFKYADKKMIPFVLLQGSDEVKKSVVMLRNMKTGEQESLSLADAMARLSQ